MTDEQKREALRKLPAVDRMLESPAGVALIEKHGKPAATSAIRKAVEQLRERMLAGDPIYLAMDIDTMAGAVMSKAVEHFRPRLREAINATGVIVHTNLGRSPLPAEAVEAFNSIAEVYSNLEYDLEKGRRGSRQSILEDLLVELIGAETAIVVNNNAGAVFLSLIALARDREVIVSRGELVEIGGSFRVPDVMAASGAVMVEVGTTNKTRIADYADAITENTAMLLKVHRSNFFIGGFTDEATNAELAELARERNVHFMVDLGSGCFVDTSRYGLAHEQTPMETLGQGAHIVTMSGDKLLGGPQAGIIAGRADLVNTLKKHPVHRAMRVDKGTLAALEATFRIYQSGRAEELIPVINMLAAEPSALKRRANAIASLLKKSLSAIEAGRFHVETVSSVGKVGGGALADAELPSWAVSIEHPDMKPEKIYAALLTANPPVVGRVNDNRLLLDVRTLWKVGNRDLVGPVTAAIESIARKD